jgi:hypothetical protein
MQWVGMPPIACRFNADIQVPISRRDTDNWSKSILDLLQHVGIITNDGNVHKLTIEPMKRVDCLIVMTPLPEMEQVRGAAHLKQQKAYKKLRTEKPALKLIQRIEAVRRKTPF